MPALPPVANVVKSRLFWTIEGDPLAVTILYWHYTSSPPDDVAIGNVAANIQDSAETRFLPLAQSGITLEQTDARDLSAIDGEYAVHNDPNPGSRTGGKLAPGTAAVVNYGIKQHYRGGKPRSYFPFGVTTDISSTGLWADAFVTAVDSAIAGFVSDVTIAYESGAFTIDKQCVVSYYGPPNKVITNGTTGRMRTVSTRRDAPGGTGHPLTYIIGSQSASKVIGSQRRRNRNA